jgi:hypothetical protein
VPDVVLMDVSMPDLEGIAVSISLAPLSGSRLRRSSLLIVAGVRLSSAAIAHHGASPAQIRNAHPLVLEQVGGEIGCVRG